MLCSYTQRYIVYLHEMYVFAYQNFTQPKKFSTFSTSYSPKGLDPIFD